MYPKLIAKADLVVCTKAPLLVRVLMRYASSHRLTGRFKGHFPVFSVKDCDIHAKF